MAQLLEPAYQPRLCGFRKNSRILLQAIRGAMDVPFCTNRLSANHVRYSYSRPCFLVSQCRTSNDEYHIMASVSPKRVGSNGACHRLGLLVQVLALSALYRRAYHGEKVRIATQEPQLQHLPHFSASHKKNMAWNAA